MNAEVSASWTYAYFILSAALFVVWLVLYGLRRDLRHSLMQVSFGTDL
jgi:hypothetical protein